jgi:CheY-like chemotaxis protein
MKVLIVDDTPSDRVILKSYLSQLGHEVVEAENGKTALKTIENQRFDLVISDVIMPEKDGIEVLSAVKKDHEGIKIILISGGGHGSAGEYLEVAKVLGADEILSKPFSMDELKSVIERALN